MSALEAVKIPMKPKAQIPRDLRLRPDASWGRWWQVLIAGAGLLLLSPICALLAFATKLTSRGPILYRGTRIGRDMKPFTIYKFRTLEIDAEQRIGARLLQPGDTLYTPVGRFLKRTKLDEIPQLWNVVKGDMNFSGPRPIRPVFLATSMKEIVNYAARFTVRPGMTGLAQLRGGYFTHPRDKLRYDVLYIRNRSWLLDVKLVLATFVKLANRWLTLGFLLALVFLSASFAPGLFESAYEVEVGGFHLSVVEIGGLLVVCAALARQIPSHRLYLYRTATNLPMLCFVVFSLVAAVVTGEVALRLRDLTYFAGSGFLFYFLVVSGEMSAGFAKRATRVVAVAAVLVALLGILEIVVQTHAGTPPRIVSTLGSPVVLAAYLVLGVPLVLVELSCAERRDERDFWLVCATLILVAVLFTQTRTSLLALWVTSALFSWRVSRRVFRLVVGAALGFLAIMVFVGGLRLSPVAVAEEWTRRVEVTREAITTDLATVRGLVGTDPGKGATTVVAVPEGEGLESRKVDNMHLTLMLRTGLIGWGLMMWIIGAALAAIYRGSHHVRDRRLELTLWAIFASGIGFLLSMSNFNSFYSAPIQIMFWGLMGLGVAIVTHLNGRRPAFNVIYRFGQGD